MKTLPFVFLILIEFLSFGQKKKVCFSFDDLPIVSYGMNDTCFQKHMFNKLIESLNKNKIPAIGFVNEKKLYFNDSINLFQLNLLKKWINNGLDLGNHTYSHLDYNKSNFKEYSDNILKGEQITKDLLNRKGKSIKYFRHPYLHVGNIKDKADSLTDFLFKFNYKVAPVTIDNEDYLFALAYKRAYSKNDTNLMVQIGNDYISYIEKKLKYFEKQANILFGRDINQILILHTSLLNSEYIDSLVTMFRNNNYVFVSIDEALNDDAYNTEINVYGDWGISWIDRWALSQGKKGDFFRNEPATPDYIRKLSE